MYRAIFKYITESTGTDIPVSQASLISKKFKFRRLKKRQFFLVEGEECEQIAFIMKGAMRMYSVDQKENETNLFLCSESCWIADLESLYEQKPSIFNIEALEETEMLVINSHDLEELIREIPIFRSAIRKQEIQNSVDSQKRLYSMLNLTATQRYDYLLIHHPQLIERFQQGMIASYLGVFPSTLSRILSDRQKDRK